MMENKIILVQLLLTGGSNGAAYLNKLKFSKIYCIFQNMIIFVG